MDYLKLFHAVIDHRCSECDVTVARLRTVNYPSATFQMFMYWCSGCEYIDDDGQRQGGAHSLPISGDTGERPVWQFDGNLDAPTLSPSVLSRRTVATRIVDNEVVERREIVCHSFIRGGMIEFLGDCTHELAGQTVPLPELPDWFADEES